MPTTTRFLLQMPSNLYLAEDFKRIAEAVGANGAAVLRYKKEFEAAAFEFRSWGKVFEKRTPTELSRKLKKIRNAARRLLDHLGIEGANVAVDGPGDREIFDVLTMTEGSDDLVTNATGRIGRLVEILEAIEGAQYLERLAAQAALERAELARLTVKPGNAGDIAINEWIAALMGIYRKIAGKDPGTSVGATDRKNEGKEGGPLIRFLQAAGQPLKRRSPNRLTLSAAALRRRVRAILAYSRKQN